MRHLIQDFLSQSWFMKAILLWGWLCLLVMAASLGDNLRITLFGA